MMLQKFIYILFIFLYLIIFNGCWSGFNVNTKSKVIDATVKSVNKTFNIKKGETLKDLIEKVKTEKVANIINEVKNPEKYIFKDDFNNVSFDSLINYLNRLYKSRIRYRTEGSNILYIIEDKKNSKKSEIVATNYIVKSFKELDKIKGLDKPINIKGDYTYNDVFYILKRTGVKIHFKIYEKSNKLDRTLPVENYFGTIKDFIKDVALENNYFVQVDKAKNTIYFTDRITKYYELKLQPVQIATSSNFETIMTDTIKPFEDLDEQLKILIGDHGIYNINKTNGVLTVYGDTLALTMSDSIVKQFNEIYGKSVKLEMHIYEVKLSSDQQAGIDFNNLLNKLSNYYVNYNGDLTDNITKVGTSLIIQEGIDINDRNQLIFKFLNEYGDAQTLTKPILETVNNLPVVMDFMDYRDYVKSIEERTTSTIGTSTTSSYQDTNVEIDEAKTGFILSMLPKIENNNIIKIVLKPQISRLNGLTPYQYGSEDNPKVIQLRDISERILTQVVKIKDDQMAIIGGYIYEKEDTTKHALPGIQRSDNPLDIFTSSKTATRSKYELVFTIKAKIIDY